MEIQFNNTRELVKLEQLDYGNTFTWDHAVYMVALPLENTASKDTRLIVDLDTGCAGYLNKNKTVEVFNGKVVENW